MGDIKESEVLSLMQYPSLTLKIHNSWKNGPIINNYSIFRNKKNLKNANVLLENTLVQFTRPKKWH